MSDAGLMALAFGIGASAGVAACTGLFSRHSGTRFWHDLTLKLMAISLVLALVYIIKLPR